jgi:hypothetical protein
MSSSTRIVSTLASSLGTSGYSTMDCIYSGHASVATWRVSISLCQALISAIIS